MTGTWELLHSDFDGWRLVLTLPNGHRVTFPLPADHGMVLGVKAAMKMAREVPA